MLRYTFESSVHEARLESLQNSERSGRVQDDVTKTRSARWRDSALLCSERVFTAAHLRTEVQANKERIVYGLLMDAGELTLLLSP